jgi:hypothetical protein
MKIGFSGTRKGLSHKQTMEFIRLLIERRPDEFHHGDCVGADQEAHDIVRAMLPGCVIVKHPPLKTYHVAHCKVDAERVPKAYLARNHDIVDETDILVACPFEKQEPANKKGGGTWSTIRYAKKKMKELTILLP